jgi:hypothetical protein
VIDKRLKYKAGQRVKKSSTGKRPGYRGSDYGDQARGTGAYSGGDSSPAAGGTQGGGTKSGNQNTGSGSTDRSRTTATQDYNTAVATGQNPLGIDMSKGPPNLTPKEIEFNKLNSFAPNKTKGFNWKSALFNIGLMAINPALAAKYGKAKSLYSGAKYAGKLANDLGLTNTNVATSLTDTVKDKFAGFSTTGKKSPKGPPDDKGNGDGDNQQNALMSEYLLLLQKMEQGVLQKEEQARFNSLKSRLGKAQGGIMDVNMNRGQLGGMNG